MNVPTNNFERQPQFDPIRVEGGLRISLFGLTIGRIRLNLDITSLDRLASAVISRTSEDESTLSTLSRAELYRLATKQRIGGRSAMSRDDLISALSTGTP